MKWLDKNQEKILFFTWCFIILTCLLVIFTSPVKAASHTDGSLPYNVPQYRDANSTISDEVLELMYTRLIGVVRDDLHYSGDVSFLVFTVDGTSSSGWSDVYFIPNPSIDTVSANYNFLDGYIRVWANDLQIFRCMVRNTNLTLNGVSVFNNQGRYADLLGDSSTSNQNGFNFTPRYPFKMIGIEEIISSNDVVVFTNTVSPVSVSGHATEPINDPDNIIDDGNGNILQRPTKPTPTPFTPQPFNPPSIDTSSLEKLVESLIDVVKYGFSYLGGLISGLFSNLLSNLGSWVDYIVQSFNFGFNNVVKAIQNLATDFYNNMVSLFEPLYDFFNGVATFFNNLIQLGMDGDSFSISTFLSNLLVPDSEDFAQALLDGDVHHVVPLVSSVHTKFVSLFNSFTNLTPSKVLVLPSFTWHNQTFNLSVDFSWYDDYKVYGDTIISGFLIIGYIYWFVLQLSSMFRGGNSIGHDVSKVGGQH